MKRRTFISMMSVMAAAGVLTLSGCSNSSTSTAASAGTSSAAGSSADQLAAIQASGSQKLSCYQANSNSSRCMGA